MISLPVIGDGRSLLTHSRMQTGKTCHRREWFKYELGLRRKKKSTPLRMGAAIHHGIDLWSNGTDENEAVFEATREYEERPTWCNTEEEYDEWLTEAEIVRRLLMAYFWMYEDDGLEIISTEEVFVVPIINPETGKATPNFHFAGKSDGVVRLQDQRIAVKETKTVGEDIGPESDYWKRLQMDQQISGYMLAARMKGLDVQTVIYDLVRKPCIKPRKLTKAEQTAFGLSGIWFSEKISANGPVPERETPQMYGARLTADIADRPEFYFARREIARLDSDIEEFRQELWEQQLDLRNRQKTGRWFRNTSACLTMGKCEYFDSVCPSRWDQSQPIPSGFEIVQHVHTELIGDDDASSATN